jgi:copper chaperone CopZ
VAFSIETDKCYHAKHEVNDMKTVSYTISGLTCPSCSTHLESLLKKSKGVSNVRLLFTLGRLKVEYDENLTDPILLAQLIARAGYHARQGAAS